MLGTSHCRHPDGDSIAAADDIAPVTAWYYAWSKDARTRFPRHSSYETVTAPGSPSRLLRDVWR
jgi:hypothetical protein